MPAKPADVSSACRRRRRAPLVLHLDGGRRDGCHLGQLLLRHLCGRLPLLDRGGPRRLTLHPRRLTPFAAAAPLALRRRLLASAAAPRDTGRGGGPAARVPLALSQSAASARAVRSVFCI
jgi:hypothetical protein